jgi:dipeptidase
MYTVWCTPQGDTELMSQEEVLDFKSVRRLEQVGDKRSNQSQDHAHALDHALILLNRANPYGCNFRE